MDPQQLQFREIHLPADIGWWPLAPGWWLLAILALAALLYVVWRWRRAWQADAWRRTAMSELARLQKTFAANRDAASLATGVSELLRRSVLAQLPRNEVAGLAGEAWLRRLDDGLPQKLFSEGPGRQLIELPYQRANAVTGDQDISALMRVARERLRTRFGEQH